MPLPAARMGDIALGRVAAAAVRTPRIAVVGPQRGDIGEAQSVDTVVADDAVGTAQLELRQHVAGRLHKVLLGDQPANGHRRKEAEAVVAGEILRTVVPEIKLGNIAAVIGVGETSREALVFTS